MKKILVTGGTGFIGSNLCRKLSDSNLVVALDNLSSHPGLDLPQNVEFIRKDILDNDLDLEGFDTVFHFAADPDVRSSSQTPEISFRTNVQGTFNVLEACRKADITEAVFASSSTVYGENKIIPTPEDSSLEPISNYGASKLAGEAYFQSYSATYGIRSTILRYANIFGEGSAHGVMYDFFHKLKENPSQLEILGNGKQAKSYLHIQDAIEATVLAWKTQKTLLEAFNVGGTSTKSVDGVAKTICSILSVSPELHYSGGERGWAGDVKKMQLDVSKLKQLGWSEQISFQEGVKRYLSWLSNKKH